MARPRLTMNLSGLRVLKRHLSPSISCWICFNDRQTEINEIWAWMRMLYLNWVTFFGIGCREAGIVISHFVKRFSTMHDACRWVIILRPGSPFFVIRTGGHFSMGFTIFREGSFYFVWGRHNIMIGQFVILRPGSHYPLKNNDRGPLLNGLNFLRETGTVAQNSSQSNQTTKCSEVRRWSNLEFEHVIDLKRKYRHFHCAD